MKLIVTIIPTKLVTTLLLSLFCPLVPAGNYTFKVNNGVVLVSLLLTLNIFHTFVLVFLLLTLSRLMPVGVETKNKDQIFTKLVVC